MHNLLFCAHTLCMNYVTDTFLLVSSSVRSKQLLCFLCFLHDQGHKREQKHTIKNFVGLHNHSPVLTMPGHHNKCKIEPRFPPGSGSLVKILHFRWPTCGLNFIGSLYVKRLHEPKNVITR